MIIHTHHGIPFFSSVDAVVVDVVDVVDAAEGFSPGKLASAPIIIISSKNNGESPRWIDCRTRPDSHMA